MKVGDLLVWTETDSFAGKKRGDMVLIVKQRNDVHIVLLPLNHETEYPPDNYQLIGDLYYFSESKIKIYSAQETL